MSEKEIKELKQAQKKTDAAISELRGQMEETKQFVIKKVQEAFQSNINWREYLNTLEVKIGGMQADIYKTRKRVDALECGPSPVFVDIDDLKNRVDRLEDMLVKLCKMPESPEPEAPDIDAMTDEEIIKLVIQRFTEWFKEDNPLIDKFYLPAFRELLKKDNTVKGLFGNG